MIKGKSRRNYNDFEEDLDQIVGNYREAYGLTSYFESTYLTFLKAETLLLDNASKYLKQFKKEDKETRYSMRNDLPHNVKAYPSVHLLRQSFFITIHSELEETWKHINILSDKAHITTKTQSLNFNYSFHNNILDETVRNWQILFSYNYIRNKLIHKYIGITSSHFILVKKQIDADNIKDIDIEYDKKKAYFIINTMEFGYTYAKIVLNFLEEIINNSYNERQQVN